MSILRVYMRGVKMLEKLISPVMQEKKTFPQNEGKKSNNSEMYFRVVHDKDGKTWKRGDVVANPRFAMNGKYFGISHFFPRLTCFLDGTTTTTTDRICNCILSLVEQGLKSLGHSDYSKIVVADNDIQRIQKIQRSSNDMTTTTGTGRLKIDVNISPELAKKVLTQIANGEISESITPAQMQLLCMRAKDK